MSDENKINDRLELASLGPTPQAALRHLVDEFERHGWKDEGTTALTLVRALESYGGSMTWKKAVDMAPKDFLASNRLYRRDLEAALRQAAHS